MEHGRFIHPARPPCERNAGYLLSRQSKKIKLDPKLLKDWKAIHEHGGDTASTGWGGEFDPEISQKGLLRTHTTVNTIQYLAKNPENPVEYSPLTEYSERKHRQNTPSRIPSNRRDNHGARSKFGNACFNSQNVLQKMGYPEVRVRPAYFPYRAFT